MLGTDFAGDLCMCMRGGRGWGRQLSGDHASKSHSGNACSNASNVRIQKGQPCPVQSRGPHGAGRGGAETKPDGNSACQSHFGSVSSQNGDVIVALCAHAGNATD